MAITEHHVETGLADRPGPVAIIKSAASGVFNFLVTIAESSAKAREMQRLQAMTDAQLAARNLSRETLYDHVFHSDVRS